MIFEVLYNERDFTTFDSCRLVCRRWAQMALKTAQNVAALRSDRPWETRLEPFMLNSDVTFTGLTSLNLTRIVDYRYQLRDGLDYPDLVTAFFRDRCPNVRALQFLLEDDQVDEVWLLDFLEQCSQLVKLTFAFDWSTLPSNSVMIHLVTRLNLEMLCTNAVIRTDLSDHILTHTLTPFASIKELEICMEGNLLQSCILGRHNSRLEHLKITVPSDMGLENLHFIFIPNLLTLDICFNHNAAIDKEGLSAMIAHPELYRLTLYARRTLRLPKYTIEQFKTEILSCATLKYVSLGQGDDPESRGNKHPRAYLFRAFGGWERGRPIPSLKIGGRRSPPQYPRFGVWNLGRFFRWATGQSDDGESEEEQPWSVT